MNTNYFLPVLCIVLVSLVSLGDCAPHFQAFSEDCENWAEKDRECTKNHPFMWSKCIESCIEFAIDDNERCEGWAEEGECANNPNYIQVHCPQSCSKAIAWNPWIRASLGIEDAPVVENPDLGEPCGGQAVDLYSAARIVHHRLSRVFAGQYRTVAGLSFAAPTEYLGLLGLAEAVLYTMRMYETTIRSAVLLAGPEHEEDLMNHLRLNKDRIDFVVSVVGAGYEADRLSRSLPSWMNLLEDSAMSAHTAVALLHGANPETYNFCEATRASPQLHDLVPYFLGEQTAAAAGEKEGTAVPALHTLSNGVQMPVVGLGTWQLQGKDCQDAVSAAIAAGYRSFDTAQAYRNEADVGAAIKGAIDKGIVKRADLFIATKLSDPADAGYAGVRKLVQKQLKDLQITYLDLYMLHSPLSDAALQKDTWRALEELLKEGTIRAIGVSNFDSVELAALVKDAAVKPMVVQNKLDVYHVGKQLDNRGDKIVSYAKENNILVVAYSTFSAYPFAMRPTEDPVVREVAQTRGLTPAQVLLKWALQKGFAVIPRSSVPSRMKENLAALTLPPLREKDLLLLDTLQYLVSSPVSIPAALA